MAAGRGARGEPPHAEAANLWIPEPAGGSLKGGEGLSASLSAPQVAPQKRQEGAGRDGPAGQGRAGEGGALLMQASASPLLFCWVPGGTPGTGPKSRGPLETSSAYSSSSVTQGFKCHEEGGHHPHIPRWGGGGEQGCREKLADFCSQVLWEFLPLRQGPQLSSPGTAGTGGGREGESHWALQNLFPDCSPCLAPVSPHPPDPPPAAPRTPEGSCSDQAFTSNGQRPCGGAAPARAR